MKLEEIKELIVKASSMENNELVCFFQSESQYANMIFNSIVDTKDERKAGIIRMMIDAEIKSLIYENEIKDRLEKLKEVHNYSVELEYKNDDLNAEIQKLKEDKKETIDSTILYYKNELDQKDWKISSLELEIEELRQKISDMQKPIEKETE